MNKTVDRIARCKGCEDFHDSCCFHPKSVIWRRVDSEASEGRRPWVWEVIDCPKNR